VVVVQYEGATRADPDWIGYTCLYTLPLPVWPYRCIWRQPYEW